MPSAADIVRAYEILQGLSPEDQEWLCALLRRIITGLPPEQAAQAVEGLFNEIGILDETILEKCGFIRR